MELAQCALLTLAIACSAAVGEIRSSGPFYRQQNAVEVPKVRMTVYFESLCSDTQRFFREQLTPTYSELSDIIDLQFVPFGKAIADPSLSEGKLDIRFECQHGPRECAGNRVMSCAQSVLSVAAQHALFACMMGDSDPPAAGKRCCEEQNINWQPVEVCSRGPLGALLLYMNGRKTAELRPRLFYIPTVTINGEYDGQSLQQSTMRLHEQVCEAYGSDHINCPS